MADYLQLTVSNGVVALIPDADSAVSPLPSNLSINNHWRSFLAHFVRHWNTAKWPETLYPVFTYTDLSETDRNKLTAAKAWIVFSYQTFAGGRGQTPHVFNITLHVKRKENMYDSLILRMADAVQECYETVPGITVYDFSVNPAQPIGELMLFPAFAGMDEDRSVSTVEVKAATMVYEVAADMWNRQLDLK